MAHKTITFATDLLPNEDNTYYLGKVDNSDSTKNRQWKFYGNGEGITGLSAENITGQVSISNGGTGVSSLTAAREKFNGPEFIRGTWTEASGVWTGVTTDSALYDGKQIILYMPFDGSGNATLNLTLNNGVQVNGVTQTTGAKKVYFESTTRFTTHKGQNSQLHLIYHSGLQLSNGTTYEGWWYVANRNTDNDYRTRQNALNDTDNTNRSILLSFDTATAADSTTARVTYRNSKFYANINDGIIYAPTFNGALVGNVTGNVSGSSGSCTGLAAKATADANNNTITDYYCTLSTAQTISGAKTFTDSITINKSDAGAIKLLRESAPNWIQAPTNGSIAFCINNALDGENGSFKITGSTVTCYNNEQATLGDTDCQWGTTYAKSFRVDKNVTLQYNSTDQSLDFIF